MSLRAGVAALLLVACGAEPARPGAAPRLTDKRALYGDPGLVPTRAGERAREELALASSIAAAVRARAEVVALAVEVRLPTAADPGAVVITGEVALAKEHVARLAEAVVGPWSVGQVQVELAPARAVASDPPARPRWALALALIGFGAAAGISIDRLLARRR